MSSGAAVVAPSPVVVAVDGSSHTTVAIDDARRALRFAAHQRMQQWKNDQQQQHSSAAGADNVKRSQSNRAAGGGSASPSVNSRTTRAVKDHHAAVTNVHVEARRLERRLQQRELAAKVAAGVRVSSPSISSRLVLPTAATVSRERAVRCAAASTSSKSQSQPRHHGRHTDPMRHSSSPSVQRPLEKTTAFMHVALNASNSHNVSVVSNITSTCAVSDLSCAGPQPNNSAHHSHQHPSSHGALNLNISDEMGLLRARMRFLEEKQRIDNMVSQQYQIDVDASRGNSIACVFESGPVNDPVLHRRFFRLQSFSLHDCNFNRFSTAEVPAIDSAPPLSSPARNDAVLVSNISCEVAPPLVATVGSINYMHDRVGDAVAVRLQRGSSQQPLPTPPAARTTPAVDNEGPLVVGAMPGDRLFAGVLPVDTLPPPLRSAATLTSAPLPDLDSSADSPIPRFTAVTAQPVRSFASTHSEAVETKLPLQDFINRDGESSVHSNVARQGLVGGASPPQLPHHSAASFSVTPSAVVRGRGASSTPSVDRFLEPDASFYQRDPLVSDAGVLGATRSQADLIAAAAATAASSESRLSQEEWAHVAQLVIPPDVESSFQLMNDAQKRQLVRRYSENAIKKLQRERQRSKLSIE